MGGVGSYKIEAGSTDGTGRWVLVDSQHLKDPAGLIVSTKSNRYTEWSIV